MTGDTLLLQEWLDAPHEQFVTRLRIENGSTACDQINAVRSFMSNASMNLTDPPLAYTIVQTDKFLAPAFTDYHW